LKNDTEAAAVKFVTSTQLFKLAESLGGVKSLLCHPANMTHKSIPAAKRRSAGVADSLIRLSVGLEEADDLVSDLDQAFTKLLAGYAYNETLPEAALNTLVKEATQLQN
jgi:cystathionine beta-lyase